MTSAKFSDFCRIERNALYRVRHHVSDLGWVDFDLECDCKHFE